MKSRCAERRENWRGRVADECADSPSVGSRGGPTLISVRDALFPLTPSSAFLPVFAVSERAC